MNLPTTTITTTSLKLRMYNNVLDFPYDKTHIEIIHVISNPRVHTNLLEIPVMLHSKHHHFYLNVPQLDHGKPLQNQFHSVLNIRKITPIRYQIALTLNGKLIQFNLN